MHRVVHAFEVWQASMKCAPIYAVTAAVMLAASVLPAHAEPQSPDAGALRVEIERLREELDALRQAYDARINDLATALAQLERQTPQAASPGTVPSTSATGPDGTLPVYGNVSALSKIFNPDLAVIGNFIGSGGSNPRVSTPALSLREVETSLQAVVDPYARADFFVGITPDGVEIEEGYITFPTLPAGLLMKAGKLRSGFGKVNSLHSHLLPWTDRPLVVTNLLGGEEGMAGAALSVARLLPNPWFFLEATGEVACDESNQFRCDRARDVTYLGRVRGYQDLSEASNLDLGASLAYGRNGVEDSSTTRLIGLDATFRFRPLRRAIYRRVLARSELIWNWRSEIGSTAFGTYVSGDYQLARRWFAGVRYDHSARPLEGGVNDSATSGILTYWPSEFSQIRGQYRRARYADAPRANEVFVQFLFSIGAHGAHPF
jgi:hypothetical protein